MAHVQIYRDQTQVEKLKEMEQLAQLEEVKQEAITAIEESELTAESEEVFLMKLLVC